MQNKRDALLEMVSKTHLTPNNGVADLLKMLTYYMYVALFRQPAPCSWMRSEVLKPLRKFKLKTGFKQIVEFFLIHKFTMNILQHDYLKRRI